MKQVLKTRWIMTLCLVALSVGAMAQPGMRGDDERRERMESARVAFLTNRLDISPEQAQQFWPLYNELEEKRREIREDMRRYRMDIGEDMTDEKATGLINKHLEARQKELDLEKEYSKRMLKVLSPQQVVQLVKAEEDFRQYIIQELRERRGDRREGRESRREGRHQDRQHPPMP